MLKNTRHILLPIVALISFSFITGSTFKSEQLKYKTVSTAYSEKWALVKSQLTKAGIDTTHFEIFLRVFKYDGQLEVWARSKSKDKFTVVDTFEICRSSGALGPKRIEGDGQVPEGFYHVSVFQPASEFYLALGVSYPNKADLLNGDKSKPGGEIMIHGNCVTIGCMPMTDDKIKEIYIMAVEAHNDGEQNIPIHIFPTRMNDRGMALLKQQPTYSAYSTFWNNLQTGYTYFETKKLVPTTTVDDTGNYMFQ